ncbi:MAG: UDP-N-acetylmuramoyl-tripeptide--D-alanyl-D-alanine ligase [Nitrospirota bacterium]
MLRMKDILDATGGTVITEGGTEFTGISIDSRTIKKGELFFALRGERFDGHDFIEAALATGGGAVVCRNAQCVADDIRTDHELRNADYPAGKTVIGVDDTLQALQDLARFIRNRFDGSVVAVIGSNGKTTTKELLSSILGTRFPVLKTTGNLNNQIGMPLSITRVEEDMKAMVLEMGTNRPGDVHDLCSIGLPDTGVITNIGYEHIEGFGSLEKVRDSELEILPFVQRMVANADDAFLMEGIRTGFKGDLVTYGIDTPDALVKAADLVFSDEGTKFHLVIGNERILIQSKLSGRFNVYNALAAAAAAHALGFTVWEIKRGIEAFGGVGMRFEIRKVDGITFLNDSYNANPSSMEVSLKELVRRIQSAEGGRKRPKQRAIAVLGDMLELGAYSREAHRKLGQWMSTLPVDVFIGVGPLMTEAVAAFRGKGMHKATATDAAQELRTIMKEGDIVLIKGSRGMRMERVLATVEEALKEAVRR